MSSMSDSGVMPAGSRRARNLFTHVVDELGGRIVRGHYQPGQALPNEAELGRELGASRSILREAVKSLAGKGLLELRPRTGTRVLAPVHWNLLDLDVLGWRYASMPRRQFIRELFEIRRMIEPAAAALAAERASDVDIAALEQFHREMEESEEAGGEAAIEADLRFHRAVLACAHNDLLVPMGGLIGVGLLASFRISSRSYGVILPLHRHVYEAVRDHRPEAARAAMDELLVRTRDYLEQELNSADEAAGGGAPRSAVASG